MKRSGIRFLVIIGLFLVSFSAKVPDDFDAIATSIRAGDAHAIALRFDKNIDLKTEDHSISYSKNQAELVLKEFFMRIVPKTFNIIHRGSSARGSRYIIGTLESAEGNYRCFVYVKDLNGRKLIEGMSFEKQ